MQLDDCWSLMEFLKPKIFTSLSRKAQVAGVTPVTIAAWLLAMSVVGMIGNFAVIWVFLSYVDGSAYNLNFVPSAVPYSLYGVGLLFFYELWSQVYRGRPTPAFELPTLYILLAASALCIFFGYARWLDDGLWQHLADFFDTRVETFVVYLSAILIGTLNFITNIFAFRYLSSLGRRIRWIN